MSRNAYVGVAAVVLCLLPCFATPARAASTPTGVRSFASNVPVNNPADDDATRHDGQAGPTIAALGNFVVAAWNDQRGLAQGSGSSLPSPIAYAYSIDGGQSFVAGGSPPLLLLGGLWSSDPIVTVNEKTGDFYLAGLYEPDNAGSVDERGVAVSRGTFSSNVLSWTTPVIVKSLLLTDGDIDQPWVAADSASGNVYLTYRRIGGAGDSIVFVRSLNRGLAWGPQNPMQGPTAAGRVERTVSVRPDQLCIRC